MLICIKLRKKEQAPDCQQRRLQTQAHRFIYLAVLEHLLQTLQHLLELARLDSAVGQQHPPKLPLGDSAVHRIIPFKLEGREEGERLSVLQRDKHISSLKSSLGAIKSSCLSLNITGQWRLAKDQQALARSGQLR